MLDDAELCEVCGNYSIDLAISETGEYVCLDCVHQELTKKELNDSID